MGAIEFEGIEMPSQEELRSMSEAAMNGALADAAKAVLEAYVELPVDSEGAPTAIEPSKHDLGEEK